MNRWPFPGDRPVDRARQVARTYRDALHDAAPEQAAHLDHMARVVGEDWVTPAVAQHDVDDWVTVAEAADMSGMSVRWVYAWVAADRDRRCYVGNDRLMRVRVGDIQAAAARGTRDR